MSYGDTGLVAKHALIEALKDKGLSVSRLLRDGALATLCLRGSGLDRIVLENTTAPPRRQGQERCHDQHDGFGENGDHYSNYTQRMRKVFGRGWTFQRAHDGRHDSTGIRASSVE